MGRLGRGDVRLRERRPRFPDQNLRGGKTGLRRGLRGRRTAGHDDRPGFSNEGDVSVGGREAGRVFDSRRGDFSVSGGGGVDERDHPHVALLDALHRRGRNHAHPVAGGFSLGAGKRGVPFLGGGDRE